MSKSIYQLICDNIKDGNLADDFSLLAPHSPDEFVWAPGAQDGVIIYHMGDEGLNSSDARIMARALKAAANKRFEEVDSVFASWCKDHRAVSIIDELQKYVIDHARQLAPGNVYQTARWLLLSSSNIECVKIGLELMELFGEVSKDDKTIIRRLGLYDEFTLFAVWNMQKWENGNEDIFYLAKNTHSWGRIHAVERLEPETEEIRKWIFTEGTVNSVVNAYSALNCWQKSDAEKILFGNMTHEEYAAMTTLIAALLDEEPAPGISELEDPAHILRQFLLQSENFTLGWEDYDAIRDVKRWIEDEADDEDAAISDIITACDVLLHSDACRATVAEAVKTGHALHMAEELDVPYLPDLFAYLRSNFEDCYYHCEHLMASPDYLEPTLDLFREHLPLNEMSGEPTNGMALGEDFETYNILDYLLQGLCGHPLTGCEFVTTAIKSPYVRQRNSALRVLQSWVGSTEKPLAELSPELYHAVAELETREINDGPKKMITPLLEGKIIFHEEANAEDLEEE